MAAARAALGRFTGADFTRTMHYEGPGQGVGNVIVPASFYGPGREYDDRASAWSHADAWMTFLAQSLPRALTFLYMPDEPRPTRTLMPMITSRFRSTQSMVRSMRLSRGEKYPLLLKMVQRLGMLGGVAGGDVENLG